MSQRITRILPLILKSLCSCFSVISLVTSLWVSVAFPQQGSLDRQKSAIEHFNRGAQLVNSDSPATEAAKEFELAYNANPLFPDAYYQRGLCLLKQTLVTPSGKILVSSDTIECFQMYLALAPEGKLAKEAKDILASLGAPTSSPTVIGRVIGIQAGLGNAAHSSSGPGSNCDANWSPKFELISAPTIKAGLQRKGIIDEAISEAGGLDQFILGLQQAEASDQDQLLQHQSAGDNEGVYKLQQLMLFNEGMLEVARCRKRSTNATIEAQMAADQARLDHQPSRSTPPSRPTSNIPTSGRFPAGTVRAQLHNECIAQNSFPGGATPDTVAMIKLTNICEQPVDIQWCVKGLKWACWRCSQDANIPKGGRADPTVIKAGCTRRDCSDLFIAFNVFYSADNLAPPKPDVDNSCQSVVH